MELLGLPCNRAFLAACLRRPEFRAGHALIPFLSQHADELRNSIKLAEEAVVAQSAHAAIFAGAQPGSGGLPCPFVRPARFRHRGRVIDLPLRDAPPSAGARCVRLDEDRWHIQIGSVDLFIDDASFQPAAGAGGASAANELRAPFNGKVIAVKAQPGTTVARGDTLLVLESMKLEHALGASRDGVIKAVHVTAGQQAATSQVLVTFEALQ
jgi:3-methylcrotonyl-CoA carboxylase alpha subunit/geranyl-CoA carboxylase alpha subunit